MTAYWVNTSALSPSSIASASISVQPVELARPSGQRPRAGRCRLHRVVADLLEAREQRQHVPAPLDPGGCRAPRPSSCRSSPGRAPPARRVSVQYSFDSWRGGRSGRTAGSVLRRRRMNGRVTRRSRSAASSSPRRSIGLAYPRRNAVRVSSSPGFRKCMIDHSSSSRFSIGVPVSAIRWRQRSARAACAPRVSGFFTCCASSSTTAPHSSSLQQPPVAGQQRVDW